MWRQRSISRSKHRNFKSLKNDSSRIKTYCIHATGYPLINFTFYTLKQMLGFQIKNKKIALIIFAVCVATISIGVLIISNQ